MLAPSARVAYATALETSPLAPQDPLEQALCPFYTELNRQGAQVGAQAMAKADPQQGSALPGCNIQGHIVPYR